MPAAPGYCLWPNLRSSHFCGLKGPFEARPRRDSGSHGFCFSQQVLADYMKRPQADTCWTQSESQEGDLKPCSTSSFLTQHSTWSGSMGPGNRECWKAVETQRGQRNSCGIDCRVAVSLSLSVFLFELETFTFATEDSFKQKWVI